MNNYYSYDARLRRPPSSIERAINFLQEWYDIVCLGIGAVTGAISALMLMALGMTDIISIVVIALAAPLLGGLLAFASASISQRYVENWCYGVAAAIGFFAGPLAFGSMMVLVQLLITSFV